MKANALKEEKIVPINYKKELTDKKIIARAVGLALLSFLFANASIFGVLSPFCIAFLAALPRKYLLTGTLGSIAGIFAFSNNSLKAYYLIAIAMIFIIKFAIAKPLKGKEKPFFLSLISTVVMLSVSIGYMLVNKTMSIIAVNFIVEAILSGTLTYFFCKAIRALFLKTDAGEFSYIQKACLAILLIAVVISLCNISLFQVNVGVIFSVIVIYFFTQKYGIIGSAISSIIIAISLNLYSPQMAKLSAVLVIASFISGVFSPLKRIGIMTSFISINIFYMLTIGAPILYAYHIIEIFFASAIFAILPFKDKTFAVKQLTLQQTNTASNDTFQIKNDVTSKLNFASGALKDVNQDLIAVSKKFCEIDGNNISTVYDVASGKVCKGCSMQLSCWDSGYDDTIRAFAPLNDILHKYSTISEDNMPDFFKDNCCKLGRLTTAINECYQAFSIKENARKSKIETRCFAIQQFNSIADMLCEISSEITDIEHFDLDIAQEITLALKKKNCIPLQVIATADKFGKTNIEIYLKSKKISDEDVCKLCCDVTDKAFDLPSICEVNNSYKISLFEKAKYEIDFYCEQHICENNMICGDSFEYFSDSKGNAYMLLSDGMGSGKRAAVDSVMTCTILSKLIKSGFSIDAAIKLINSSLLLKSTDESLATIDITRVDLYSGKAEFLKAGAAASFVLTRGGGTKISASTLPIGILQDISFDKKIAKLQEDDIICLVSDGVCDNGDEWILSSLQKCSHLSAKEISSKILFEAKTRLSSDIRADDMSVLIAKIL